MTKINLYLGTPQIVTLREISEKTGISVAELVRRAVDAYLQREDKKQKRGQ